MDSSSGATDKTRLAKKSSLTIVIGAAIGGLVGMLIMIIIIIIISICICLKRKTKQLDLSYDLPGNHQSIVCTHQFLILENLHSMLPFPNHYPFVLLPTDELFSGLLAINPWTTTSNRTSSFNKNDNDSCYY